MGIGSRAYRAVHTKGGLHQPIWTPVKAGDHTITYRCAVCGNSLIMGNETRFVTRRRRRSGWPRS